MTNADKARYLQADQCLMDTAPQYGIPGAQNVWEELQYAHIRNMNWIHGVASDQGDTTQSSSLTDAPESIPAVASVLCDNL